MSLQNFVSVTNYTTGTSNDTAAVQAALNAAAGGGLIIPGGLTLTCDTLTPSSNTRIIGGCGSTFQQRTRGQRLFNINGKEKVHLDGLRIKGECTSATAAEGGNELIFVQGSSTRITVSDCVISNSRFLPFWAENSSEIIFRDNTCYNNCGGVYFSTVTGGDIRGNTVRDPLTYNATPITGSFNIGIVVAGDTAGVSVVGNRIKNLGWSQGIAAHTGLNVQIIGNFIQNCSIGIDYIALAGDAVYGLEIIGNRILYDPNIITSASPTDVGSLGIRVAADLGTNVAHGAAINGNTIFGINTGAQSSAGCAGILISATQGAAVCGNSIKNTGANGILVYGEEKGFAITGNTMMDLVKVGGQQNGIYLPATGAIPPIGTIGANMITNLADAAGTGIYRGAASPNLTISSNATYNVTTPLV